MIQGLLHEGITACVIRTLPNSLEKKTKNWSGTNPPYVVPEVMELLIRHGIEHVLIDLPSVDKEMDEGRLAAHKAWWSITTNQPRVNATITEMIFVDNEVPDGLYLLQMGVCAVESDASPSRITLYPLSEI
jgi:kynurenine formamidase